MRCLRNALGLGALVLAVSGCNKDSQTPTDAVDVTPTSVSEDKSAVKSSSGVAVIDLDAVAQRVGRLDEINESVKEKESALNEKLALLQASYHNEFKAKRDEYGDEPTDEQNEELLVQQRRINNGVGQAQRKYQQELEFHKNALKRRFHEEVKPLALQVANRRDMNVVVLNNFIFAAGDAVDITDAVVEHMLSNISSSNVDKKSGDAPHVSELPHGGTYQP